MKTSITIGSEARAEPSANKTAESSTQCNARVRVCEILIARYGMLDCMRPLDTPKRHEKRIDELNAVLRVLRLDGANTNATEQETWAEAAAWSFITPKEVELIKPH